MGEQERDGLNIYNSHNVEAQIINIDTYHCVLEVYMCTYRITVSSHTFL